ncbi:MAG: hypothetical protein ACRC1H_08100 [Caldilineaceae bacterium]
MTTILLPLALLFVASALYAFLLGTRLGREFSAAATWVTVVAGTSLVLGAYALWDPWAALWALLFFVVGGVPIVIGEIIKDFQAKRRLAQRAMKQD